MQEKKNAKNTNIWSLNYSAIKASLKKSKRKLKIPRDNWKWKHNYLKPVGHSKSSSKSKAYHNTIAIQKTRKIPNKQPKLTAKTTRKRPF